MNIEIGFKCGKCAISNTKTISKGKRDLIYFILNEIALQKQVITRLTLGVLKCTLQIKQKYTQHVSHIINKM